MNEQVKKSIIVSEIGHSALLDMLTTISTLTALCYTIDEDSTIITLKSLYDLTTGGSIEARYGKIIKEFISENALNEDLTEKGPYGS